MSSWKTLQHAENDMMTLSNTYYTEPAQSPEIFFAGVEMYLAEHPVTCIKERCN